MASTGHVYHFAARRAAQGNDGRHQDGIGRPVPQLRITIVAEDEKRPRVAVRQHVRSAAIRETWKNGLWIGPKGITEGPLQK